MINEINLTLEEIKKNRSDVKHFIKTSEIRVLLKQLKN